MHVIGVEETKIEDLLPANWEELIGEDEVRLRAGSIEILGQLQEPMVRKRDLALVFGLRRILAHKLLGYVRVKVKMVDCTDEELLMAKKAENAEREHSKAKASRAITELIEFYDRKLQDMGGAPSAVRSPRGGRPRSTRGEARRKVAEITGRSEAAIRQYEYAERRAKRSQRRTAAALDIDPSELADPTEPLETWGMELEPDFLMSIAQVRKVYAHTLRQLAASKARFTRLSRTDVPLQQGAIGRAKLALEEAHGLISSMAPVALCPYCKALPELLPRCATCLGTGYVGKRTIEVTPDELKGLAVMVDGKPVSVYDLAGETPEPTDQPEPTRSEAEIIEELGW